MASPEQQQSPFNAGLIMGSGPLLGDVIEAAQDVIGERAADEAQRVEREKQEIRSTVNRRAQLTNPANAAIEPAERDATNQLLGVLGTGPAAAPKKPTKGFDVTSTTTTQRGPLSKEQAATFKARNRQLTAELKGEKSELNAKRELLLVEHDKVAGQWIEEAQKMRETLGERGKGVAARFEQATKQFDKIRSELANTKIDTTRIVDNMPTWAKALTMISTVIDSGTAAVLNRKPQVIKMVNQAIEQDIRTQRANISLALQRADISDRERRFAFQRWMQVEGAQRKVATRLSQLQLGQIALKDERLQNKMAAVEGIFQLDQGLVQQELQADIQSGARRSTVTRKVPRGGGSAKSAMAQLKLQQAQLKAQRFETKERETVVGMGEYVESARTYIKDIKKAVDDVGGEKIAAAILSKPLEGALSEFSRLAGAEKIQRLFKVAAQADVTAQRFTKAVAGGNPSETEQAVNQRLMFRPGDARSAIVLGLKQRNNMIIATAVGRAKAAALEGRSQQAAALVRSAQLTAAAIDDVISEEFKGVASTPSSNASRSRTAGRSAFK